VSAAVHACAVCGGPLAEVTGFARLPRVTSDSRPFRPGGRISSCAACAAIQKIPDERWFAEIREIYSGYDIYHQSGGVDQPVFDAGTGRARPRSAALVESLAAGGVLAARGRALDVGCGGGAFLAALAQARPGWRLFGNDLGDRNERSLRAIPGFEALYTGDLTVVPGRYDLVSLIHSLEHLPAPVDSLRALQSKLAPAGRLFIQVPDVARTPFDLVVADHLSHFSARALADVVARAGFVVERLAADVVVKELTLVARLPDGAGAAALLPDRAPGDLAEKLGWLERMIATASTAAIRAPFGLFGTSIAAVWLLAGLEERVAFFVDEDRVRIGRPLFGRPVLAPEEVPAGATVMLALIPEVAHAVAARLAGLPVGFVLPPERPG